MKTDTLYVINRLYHNLMMSYTTVLVDNNLSTEHINNIEQIHWGTSTMQKLCIAGAVVEQCAEQCNKKNPRRRR